MKNTAMTLKRFMMAFVLVAILAGLLPACGGKEETPIAVPAGAQAGDLVDLQACTYSPSDDVEYAADCGTLVVPENRQDPDSRLIALPIVRLNATGNSPGEPIFWLAGGPGASNMHLNPPREAMENHEFVMVGYRGVDGSVVLDVQGWPRRGGVWAAIYSVMSLLPTSGRPLRVARRAWRMRASTWTATPCPK